MLWLWGFDVALNEGEVATTWAGHVARTHTYFIGKNKYFVINVKIILKRILCT